MGRWPAVPLRQSPEGPMPQHPLGAPIFWKHEQAVGQVLGSQSLPHLELIVLVFTPAGGLNAGVK